MTSATPTPSEAPGAPPRPPLRRTPRQKAVAGVCGGLGRYFDLDPVVFRVVTGVLAAAGGTGLIFYGLAWLCVTADGEDENEARRLLTGRVEGASLIAVLTAMVGCGLFLSMVGGNGGTIGFALLLVCAVGGAAVWSRRRRLAGGGESAAAPHPAGPDAPPETKAPPLMVAPSWWRDPIVKDGSTGPVPVGYLWGPADGPHAGLREDPHRAWGALPDAPRRAVAAPREPRSVGGLVLLLAAAAGYAGTAATWDGPLGVSLQFGLGAALAVFASGLIISSFLGRTGFGTLLMTVVTALLLAGASAVPPQIGTAWTRAQWAPASLADLRPRYTLGTGVGALDLSALEVPRGRTVEVAAEAGAGRLAVTVPAGVTVRVRARAGVGEIRLPGPAADRPAQPPGGPGVAADRDVTRTVPPPPGVAPGGTLELDLRIAVGRVEVARAAS
ncbi:MULTISPECIES: PspC domain-containing protein [Streptomyces]|uniref:PspC domain-containing protein n=1 Tax=Streptomyces sudanensis TaxID=436397 RepID=A0ABY4TAE9_9ACTN|nr:MULTISPECIES: PspC domain-containing protein [Streptomyces]MCP9957668.1 PspC domain-containing protein [Streptomyces sudanensis]MCQ0001790.1 PspC domain-containing protein [Streptomyces sudanensis]URN15356.1 PspC domain-containing protein [Streptomyces sudanensis]